MKIFKKCRNNNFLCEECGLETTRLTSLSHHIKSKYGQKIYFDKWIKEENDDKCNVCNETTEFINISNGYKKYCCKKCEYVTRNNSIRKSFKKNGLEISKKRKKSCQLKFGVDNPSKDGNIKNKKVETCLKNNGVMFGFQQTDKTEHTMLLKYGVKNPSESPILLEKQQKSARKIHQYNYTKLTYQGSYEKDFLDRYYSNFNLEKGPTIKYSMDEKIHTYHSDFFLPEYNLVVEIKNSYLYNRDYLEIKAKEEHIIKNGFNYILILEKNYEKLDNILNKI